MLTIWYVDKNLKQNKRISYILKIRHRDRDLNRLNIHLDLISMYSLAFSQGDICMAWNVQTNF